MSARFPTVHSLYQTSGVLRHLSRMSGFLPDAERRIPFVRVYAKLHGATPIEMKQVLHYLEPALEVYPADD